jgi:hypothetical protein
MNIYIKFKFLNMKHLKTFEFFFYPQSEEKFGEEEMKLLPPSEEEEEDNYCKSCGCEECECTEKESEDEVKGFPTFFEEEEKFEAKKSKSSSYKKSGLKNPEKADLNKDKKISGYEKTRGKAIQKSIEGEDEETPSKGKRVSKKQAEKLPAALVKAMKAGVRD